MKTYDWIVVGGGMTGAALSYELVSQGLSVLLLEQDRLLQGGTRYSYGGIAYWSGTTDLTRQLCQESISLYRSLSAELDSSIEFREMDLLLTIAADHDPDTIANSYAHFAISPVLLSVADACELEPLLNPDALSAALRLPHGHVNPERMVHAYNQAFLRLGGDRQIGKVTRLLKSGDRVQGVATAQETTYASDNVVICAGGMTRSLLRENGIAAPTYFTHAELIETPPLDLRLQTIVMPAEAQRFDLEAAASQAKLDALWDQPGRELADPILDAGAVQFCDGSLRLGQISRVLTDPDAEVNAAESETAMRTAIGAVLPALQDVPGQWHHCLVGFSRDRLPLIGSFPDLEGIHVFSGFSNPFALFPTLSRRYAKHIAVQPDPVIEQMSPNRFT